MAAAEIVVAVVAVVAVIVAVVKAVVGSRARCGNSKSYMWCLWYWQ